MSSGRLRVDERGSASAELVVAMPLLLLMLLGIVQFAVWSHATHIAQAAASQGLAATRAHNGTAGAGQIAAQQVLDQLADGPLTHPHIQVHRGIETASVRISGRAAQVIPLIRLPVRAEAAGPLENWSTL